MHILKHIGLCLSAFMLFGILSCQKKKEDTLSIKETQVEEKIAIPSWINAEYVMGLFEPSTHPDFAEIDVKYADRAKLYLRKEVMEAFKEMWSKAKEDGHTIQIKSATRNFNYQKGIWERKWNGQTKLSDGTSADQIVDTKARALKILLYSSMPGTSRHHWGTDIDINSFENAYFETGEGLRLYEWMQEYAGDFGFCQPYTSKSGGRTGYEEEKWHWSYKPISQLLTMYCSEHINNKMVQGFDGSEEAAAIDVTNNYIQGIDPMCIHSKQN